MNIAVDSVTLVLAGLLSVFTTLTAAARPDVFAKQLGLSIDNAGGTNEIRSQYAGFFLAAAIACGAGLAGYISRREGTTLVVVIFGGLFIGRLFSLILNKGFGGYSHTVRALCFIDAVGLALSVAALVAES
jgi:hypothetical protein